MKTNMWRLSAFALALAASAGLAQAEPTPAKKELIAKVLQLQEPVREQVVRQLAQGPLGPLSQQVSQILQVRVPPEKREALTKEFQGYVGKYLQETTALLHEREAKLAPTVVGPMLDEKFSEEELKQLIAFLESPVQRKYAQLAGDTVKALSAQLVTDTRGVVEPKYKALEQTVSRRLNEVTAAAANPPAKPASK